MLVGPVCSYASAVAMPGMVAPETRAASACPYCDTDFRGGDQLACGEIIDRLLQQTGDPQAQPERLGCVLTGGEPLLQADAELLQALVDHFAWVDIETNGTREAPLRHPRIYYSCSPKRSPAHQLS